MLKWQTNILGFLFIWKWWDFTILSTQWIFYQYWKMPLWEYSQEWMEFSLLQAPSELFRRTMNEWLIRNVSGVQWYLYYKRRFKSSIFSRIVRKNRLSLLRVGISFPMICHQNFKSCLLFGKLIKSYLTCKHLFLFLLTYFALPYTKQDLRWV